VAPSLVAYAVFTLGGVIATEGALAFLGFSVPLPTPSWGNMISDQSNLDPNDIFLLLAPAIGLFLTLMSLNYIGARVQRRYDSNESKL
jgi:peptide/nickel transport system permease protein